MGGRPPFRPGRQRLRVRAAPAAQSLCALGRSAGRYHAGTWRSLPRRGRWHRRDHQGDDASLSLGIYEAVSMIVHVLPPIGQGRSSRADLTPLHLEGMGKRRWCVDSRVIFERQSTVFERQSTVVERQSTVFERQSMVSRCQIRSCPAAVSARQQPATRWLLPASSPAGARLPVGWSVPATAGRPVGSVRRRTAPGSG